MRVLFAILLSCILSLNLFFYSEELQGYSATLVTQNTVNKTSINDLRSLGYYKYEYKDENLNFRNAVLHFQSDCNLTADGIAGKQFQTALYRRLQQGKEVVYSDYVKKSPSSKMWLTINKSNKILTVYWNKTAIKKYPVAIGRTNFVTPAGKFRIKSKVINPKWSGGGHAEPVNGGDKNNPLGYRWLGLNIGNKNKYGIHGNNNPYSIGQNVSRGCIRMLNSDVEDLYQKVNMNTFVWIGTDRELRKWGVHQNGIIN
ncbi:MAG: ErfK/YbiS/YcfS/YnhG family protein [Massilibacillus sp.]|nr:ErfK/YbiS/YcfS/YnhG family protein [Massilibacillus sp.]